ncbi:MAG: phosphate ABC transporter substrate-binding protein, partial [Acidimicrobiales bacterium]
VKGVEIDGGAGCVASSSETVQAGTYTPLGRELFIYVKAASAQRPEVKAFAKYYFDNQDSITDEALFVPLTAEQVTKATQELAAITGG